MIADPAFHKPLPLLWRHKPDGYLFDMRVYKAVLTQAQINVLVNDRESASGVVDTCRGLDIHLQLIIWYTPWSGLGSGLGLEGGVGA